MKARKQINWMNTLFLTITPAVGILGTVALAFTKGLYWQTLLLAVLLWIMGGISITAGYHRLFSHVTYKTNALVRLLFAIFGSTTFEGSILEWSTDHRDHHRYTDTPQDPYSINEGFWHAHIGWLFTLDITKRDFNNVQDLAADPIVRFQHRYFVPIAIVFGFVLPMYLGYLWGDALGGLIIAGALRITFIQHMTFFINSVCHLFGKQTYSDRNSARDNWFTALFTFGEGFHNYHHKFPIDYRNGIRFYHFDPAKWLIKTLEWAGLASDLKTVSQHRIIKNKLDMDQKRLEAGTTLSYLNENSKAMVQYLYDSIMQLTTQLESLEKTYQQLKRDYVHGRTQEYRELIRKHHQELKSATLRLKYLLKTWSYIMKHNLVPPGLSLEV